MTIEEALGNTDYISILGRENQPETYLYKYREKIGGSLTIR